MEAAGLIQAMKAKVVLPETASSDDKGFPFSDSTYLRYLRARNNDVDKASEMLNNTITWRNTFGLPGLYRGDWKQILSTENATGKMFVRGFDREGHPLVYLRPKCENTFDHNGNLKHMVFQMEKAIKTMESEGKGVEKLALLIDFDGYSVFNAPPMSTSMETLNILQNHYPERLHRAYCLNPPWLFQGFWSVISPFIDPVTKKKIVMVTDLKTLEKDIDPAMLETSIGGKDSRPFDSSLYINGDFNKEFNAILSDKENELGGGDKGKDVAASTTPQTVFNNITASKWMLSSYILRLYDYIS